MKRMEFWRQLKVASTHTNTIYHSAAKFDRVAWQRRLGITIRWGRKTRAVKKSANIYPTCVDTVLKYAHVCASVSINYNWRFYVKVVNWEDDYRGQHQSVCWLYKAKEACVWPCVVEAFLQHSPTLFTAGQCTLWLGQSLFETDNHRRTVWQRCVESVHLRQHTATHNTVVVL